MIKVGLLGIGGLSSCCFGSVAVGLGDAHQFELLATWASLLACLACLCRSPIHVLWGGYLTRHPEGPAWMRQALVELNFLVPLNVCLCVIWIWIAAAQLGHRAPQPPLALALGFAIVLVLVAMETVRCAKRTGKRRGTEIVCEGPVGEWFRDLFETSNEEGGLVHRVMRFFRYPNSPKFVSRFLYLLVALMFLPVPVHSSAAAGKRLKEALFAPSPAPPIVEGANDSPTPPAPGAGGDAGEPSFEAQCGGPYEAAPAPKPNREQIEQTFEAAGARQAGCPGTPEEVLGQPGVWIAPAHCGGELRSLVATAPDYLPALLYQQAAGFALARGREGTLLGASARHALGGGDFYVLDTSLGSFVLIRRHSSSGRISGARAGELPCRSYTSGNFTYTVVPPGLIGLWLQLAEEGEWLFPVSSSPSGEGSGFEFLEEDPTSEALASATCSSDLICSLRIDGEVRQSSGEIRYVSVAEITNLAG